MNPALAYALGVLTGLTLAACGALAWAARQLRTTGVRGGT